MVCYITTSDDLDIIMYLVDGMQFANQKIQLLFLVKHEFIIVAFMIVSVKYQFICYGLMSLSVKYQCIIVVFMFASVESCNL
jgi:hypothetical protein